MTRFWKSHAYGNDFIYVRKRDVEGGVLHVLAREMCDRHSGVGADGLVVFEHDDSRRSASMRLFNADGSVAEVSGNGVRALAALVLQDETSLSEIDIVTDAGSKRLIRTERRGSRQTFRAEMGQPVDVAQATLTVDSQAIQVVTLNMGNPQCVILGALPDQERFRRIGAALEHHDAFPQGTNIEFAHVESPGRVDILIWERGVGPTTSSGTGSCAALVAAAAFGGAARDADVVAPGGVQRVSWTEAGVFLTGWAELICTGEWLRQIPRTA